MSKEVLVTGASGFAGSHQVDREISEGHNVTAQVRKSSDLSNLSEAQISNSVNIVHLDLRDGKDVSALIEAKIPDVVVHLAADSDVSRSLRSPMKTVRNNMESTRNILEAARKFSPNATIIIAGSSHEYGTPLDNTPLHEDLPLRPENPYAVEKVLEGYMMSEYGNLRIVKARIFNHFGPRRSANFLDGKLVKEAVAAKLAETPWRVTVGSREYSRDRQHVGNWIDANLILAEVGNTGEAYNVCSGETHSVVDLIEGIASTLDLRVEIEEDESLLRPGDPLKSSGDNTKLRSLGWSPERNFSQMIDDAVAWRMSLDRK